MPIHIQDKDNLTDDEKSAIMIMLTGNPDIYSYAAENQFHADAYINSGKIKYIEPAVVKMAGPALGWIITNEVREKIESSAIVSNAGVGEADGMEKDIEILFKTEGRYYYKEQKEAHTKE